jgi:hypothetical protein
MSMFNWLLSLGAIAAIIELLWWIGVIAWVIRFTKKEDSQ